jgi:uncharacterized protein affecting Mg2+/Co2+ transport
MKIKNLIEKLQKLDQEAEINYLEENAETNEETYFNFAICENQVKQSNELIERYYTIEKHD